MENNIAAYLPWIVSLWAMLILILATATYFGFRLAKTRQIQLEHIHRDLAKASVDRVETEESKQALEKALLQGQKLQAIGTLAGGIAHDFNNILYAIKGYVELAREDVDKDQLVYKNLGKVLEASQRGQELVSRLLSFSRRHHHDFAKIDLNSTIEGMLSFLRPTIPASVIVTFKPEKNYTILGNQTQLQQVIMNLINNGVDAMDGEGTITISLAHMKATDTLLKKFIPMPAQNYCMIDITDTGSGMDQKTVQRIFEPFFTTKEVGKGTGLGLSIAHSVVKEHQGEIAVKSQLGVGTTFTIFLPEYEGDDHDHDLTS